MVVVDETSKIKNFAAKRTKIVMKIGQKTKYKMVLTGTPITQGAHDIFSQWLFLDKGSTFGSSQERFLERYFRREGWKGVPKGGRNGWALKEISELIFNRANTRNAKYFQQAEYGKYTRAALLGLTLNENGF